MLKRFLVVSIALAAIGCGDTGSNTATGGSNSGGGPSNPGVTYRQIEQLARPAVCEGLLFSNDLLLTYNAVPPSFVAAALAGQQPEANQAGPVLLQAQTVLNLTTGFAPGGFTTGQIVTAMLPDVMRIDTKINMAVATEAYSFFNPAHINGINSPIAGRKLLDDVVDQTYGALVAPGVTDNVPYYPVAGNPGVGHQNLNGQTVQNGAATFPFLAPAN